MSFGPDVRGAHHGRARSQEPAPPPSEGLPWRPFPVHALPPLCRAMAEHGAKSHGIDAAYFAVPQIGVLAGCVGTSRWVAVKGDWYEPSVLFTAVVAPSGAGKSGALRAVLEPLRERDRELRDASARAREEAEHAIEQWKANRKRADGDPGEPPSMPPYRCSVVADATIERIATLARDNPRGLTLAVDELGQWFGSMTRYRSGKGSDEPQWLSAFGAGPVVVDRQGRASVHVPHAAISVLGTVQPAILKLLFGFEQRASGLMSRFLFAEPPVTAPYWTDATIPKDVENGWGRIVRSLLELSHDPEQRHALDLDPAAQAAFIEFHDKNVRDAVAAHEAGDSDLAAALSKLRGIGARIAAAVALARAAEQGMAELLRSIPEQDMRSAIEIAEWFGYEARRLYARLPTGGGSERSEADIDRATRSALENGPKDMTELHRAHGGRLAAERIRASCRRIGATMEWQATGGRRREVWSVVA